MMLKPDVLVDSSFLCAVYDQSDAGHSAARQFMRSNRIVSIVPEVILSEVTFLLNRSGGQLAVEFFLQSFEATKPRLESIQVGDLKRVREVLRTYPRAPLDFVDCCIVAMSERLNITRVCTFDRRDFSILRPAHCEFLELLP